MIILIEGVFFIFLFGFLLERIHVSLHKVFLLILILKSFLEAESESVIFSYNHFLLLRVLRSVFFDLLEGSELKFTIIVKIGDKIIELLLNRAFKIKNSIVGVVEI